VITRKLLLSDTLGAIGKDSRSGQLGKRSGKEVCSLFRSDSWWLMLAHSALPRRMRVLLEVLRKRERE